MHHWKYFLILWIQCSVTLERTIRQKMQCKSYLIMFANMQTTFPGGNFQRGEIYDWLICVWAYLKWSQLPCGEISGVEIQHIVEKFQIGHIFSFWGNYKSTKFQIIIHSNIISVCFAKNIRKVDSTYSYFRRQCARSQCLKWLRCKVISIIQLDKTISSLWIVVSFVKKHSANLCRNMMVPNFVDIFFACYMNIHEDGHPQSLHHLFSISSNRF